MRIIITPEDLVKRCIWDSYIYYILGTDKDAIDILSKNEEFEISERDALVIGLLKIIETENLIHKFNTYITELLTNRSVKNNNELIIRKKVFDAAVDGFMCKFPEYWKPSLVWQNALLEVSEYIDNFKNSLDKVAIIDVMSDDVCNQFYTSNTLKKLLKFKY